MAKFLFFSREKVENKKFQRGRADSLGVFALFLSDRTVGGWEEGGGPKMATPKYEKHNTRTQYSYKYKGLQQQSNEFQFEKSKYLGLHTSHL